MIDGTLRFITDELNDFLGRKDHRYLNSAPAVLSDLLDQEGKLIPWNNANAMQSNIVVTLINVEEETVGKSQLPYHRRPDNTIGIVNPEVKLNLHVLFSCFSTLAADTRYQSCLELLSYVVRFFQSRNVFDRQNFPKLPPAIEKLIVELESLTFEQQNHLWGSLGVKYVPSVLYKIRPLPIREMDDSLPGPLIEEIQTTESVP